MDNTRRSQNPLSDAFLMYEKFHANGFGMNVLYSDFHVAGLKATATVQGMTN